MKPRLTLYYSTLVLTSLFIGLPVLYTFLSVFFDTSALPKIIDTGIFLLLLKSILLAGLIALFSLISGSFFAFILYKTKLKNRGLLKLLMISPLFISPYVLAVAWKDFYFLLMHSQMPPLPGMLLVLTIVYTPLALLIVGSALQGINAHMEESALMLSGRKSLIRRIILPMIKPALLSAFVLIFIFSLSSFAVPAYFGMRVFTTEIFTQFSAFYNYPYAILQSGLLILISLALLLSEWRYLADAPFISMGNKGSAPRYFSSIAGQGLDKLLLAFWIFISIGLPLLVLLYQSFSGGAGVITKAFLLLLPTLSSSLLLALAAALISVLIGFVPAWFKVRHRQKTDLYIWILLIIFAVPSIIYGISLIKFYNRPALNFIYSTYAIILIAFVGKFAFISEKLIENGLKQIPKSFIESAEILGASETSMLRRIITPLLLPSLFAAFLLVFIFSLGELGTAIMVYPPGTELMSIKVFTLMANASQSFTASMSLLVFSLTLAVIGIFGLGAAYSLKKNR